MKLAISHIFGNVDPPPGVDTFAGGQLPGISILINIFINLLIVGAGIYTLFNIIFAGYSFLSAGDDPKKVEGAWAKIYQSVIGLSFVAGSFVIAALIGKVLFNDTTFLLRFRIFTSS